MWIIRLERPWKDDLVSSPWVLWESKPSKYFIKKNGNYCIIVWVVPPPSKSHHQDYYIFSRESQPKPSFPLLLGGGTTQIIVHHRCLIYTVWYFFLSFIYKSHLVNVPMKSRLNFERGQDTEPQDDTADTEPCVNLAKAGRLWEDAMGCHAMPRELKIDVKIPRKLTANKPEKWWFTKGISTFFRGPPFFFVPGVCFRECR